MFDIPRIIKNQLFERLLKDFTEGENNTFLPFSVILLNKLTSEEINNLQFCDHYISNLNSNYKPLPESLNIKKFEMAANSSYVRGGIKINKELSVKYDSKSTIITSNDTDLSAEWKPLDGTFHGYAVIGNKPLTVSDTTLTGLVFPVLCYEYYDSPVVMKNDDFKIIWSDVKLKDSMVKYLLKW